MYFAPLIMGGTCVEEEGEFSLSTNLQERLYQSFLDYPIQGL